MTTGLRDFYYIKVFKIGTMFSHNKKKRLLNMLLQKKQNILKKCTYFCPLSTHEDLVATLPKESLFQISLESR